MSFDQKLGLFSLISVVILLGYFISCNEGPDPKKVQSTPSPLVVKLAPAGVEQVRIFSGPAVEVETEINLWLEENAEKIEVTNRLQSGTGSYVRVIVSIFYKRTK